MRRGLKIRGQSSITKTEKMLTLFYVQLSLFLQFLIIANLDQSVIINNYLMFFFVGNKMLNTRVTACPKSLSQWAVETSFSQHIFQFSTKSQIQNKNFLNDFDGISSKLHCRFKNIISHNKTT